MGKTEGIGVAPPSEPLYQAKSGLPAEVDDVYLFLATLFFEPTIRKVPRKGAQPIHSVAATFLLSPRQGDVGPTTRVGRGRKRLRSSDLASIHSSAVRSGRVRTPTRRLGYEGALPALAHVNSLAGKEAFLLDSGAAMHVFHKDTDLVTTKRHRIAVNDANGHTKTYETIGFHAVFGWGICGGASANLISLSQIQQKFHVTYASDLDYFLLREMSSGKSTMAQPNGGLYLVDMKPFGSTHVQLGMEDDIHSPASVFGAFRSPNLQLNCIQRVRLLHRVLAHPSAAAMKSMLTAGAFSQWQLAPEDVDKAEISHCFACLRGRNSRHRHVSSSVPLPSSIATNFHCDFYHDSQNNIYLFSVEAVTKYLNAVRMVDETEASMEAGILTIQAFFTRLAYSPNMTFTFDAQPQMDKMARKDSLLFQGITLVVLDAGRHEKVAEVFTKEVDNCKRSVAGDFAHIYKLPLCLDGFLLQYVIESINHRSVGGARSRWSLVHHKPDDGEFLGSVSFGTPVFVKAPSGGDKSDFANRLAIVVGRNQGTRVLDVWSISEGYGLLRRVDVITPPWSQELQDMMSEWEERMHSVGDDEFAMLVNDNTPAVPHIDPDFVPQPPHVDSSPREDSASPCSSDSEESHSGHTQVSQTTRPQRTRAISSRGRQFTNYRDLAAFSCVDFVNEDMQDKFNTLGLPEHVMLDEDVFLDECAQSKLVMIYQMTEVTIDNEDENHHLAVESQLAEARNLLAYNALEFLSPSNLTSFPPTIPLLLITTRKVDAFGKFVKYKSRICCRGDRLNMEGHGPTTSPVVSIPALNLLFNKFASSPEMGVSVADVRSAYLEAKLETDVWVSVQPALANLFVQADNSLSPFQLQNNGSMIAKLKRAVYGLPMSGKLWYDHLWKILSQFGLRRSQYDQSVFFMNLPTGMVYVDDLLMFGPRDVRESFHKFLAVHLQEVTCVHDPREFSFLGMAVSIGADRSISLSLPKLEEDLIELLSAQGTADHPYAPIFKGTDGALDKDKSVTYRTGVAKLLYLATHTRPELRLIVSLLAMNQIQPTLANWKQLVHVGQYLRSHPKQGIRFSPSKMQLHASADSSYRLHKENSRGQNGIVISFGLGNAPVFCNSSKQDLNVLSSMEGEGLALAACVKQLARLVGLAEEMGCKQDTIPIQQDNQSLLIELAKEFHVGSSAAWNQRFHFVLEQQSMKTFTPYYVASEDVVADYLTKPSRNNFVRWSHKLSNWP